MKKIISSLIVTMLLLCGCGAKPSLEAPETTDWTECAETAAETGASQETEAAQAAETSETVEETEAAEEAETPEQIQRPESSPSRKENFPSNQDKNDSDLHSTDTETPFENSSEIPTGAPTESYENQYGDTVEWIPSPETESQEEPTTPRDNTEYRLTFQGVQHTTNYILSNGQDIFTKIYGSRPAAQIGDVVTFKIEQLNGTTPYDSLRVSGGTYEVVGDQLLVTVDGSDRDIFAEIYYSNDNGSGYTCDMMDNVIFMEGRIDQDEYPAHILNYYLRDTLGLYNEGSGAYIYMYTAEQGIPAVTGVDFYGEDLIPIAGNPDWLEDAMNLLDQLKAMGCKVVSLAGGAQKGEFLEVVAGKHLTEEQFASVFPGQEMPEYLKDLQGITN